MMGNAMLKDNGESEGLTGSTTTTTTTSGSLATQKHSTNQRARILSSGGKDTDKEKEKVDFLNEQQKTHIRNCWKRIESDVASVGIITFTQLFETHPDVKEVFMPFNGVRVEELQHSKQLRSHALRVMALVGKAVARLEEREKLDRLLEDLGKAHFYYGAPKKYIDLIGPQFIKAIEPSLQEIWDEDVHEAWIQLFRYIAQQMKEALTAAEKAKRISD